MLFNQYGDQFWVRIDKGEEILETIKKFCSSHKITLGSIFGIGAVNRANIGLFEAQTKQYHKKELTGDHEITSLTGNISTMNHEVYLHIHVNLSNSNFSTFGGHLISAMVSGTCEVMIKAIAGKCEREFDEEVGLNLMQKN